MGTTAIMSEIMTSLLLLYQRALNLIAGVRLKRPGTYS